MTFDEMFSRGKRSSVPVCGINIPLSFVLVFIPNQKVMIIDLNKQQVGTFQAPTKEQEKSTFWALSSINVLANMISEEDLECIDPDCECKKNSAAKDKPDPEPECSDWQPVVYVSGPYRAPTREGVEVHIQSAKSVAVKAALKGWAVVCPHMNTGGLELCAPGISDEFWLDSALELLRRCDAVVLAPGWSESAGSQREVDVANRQNIPVYRSIDDLILATEFAEIH